MNKRIGTVIAVAVLASGLPGVARADRLDQRLHEEMPAILQKLKDKKYKNVGVMRFRVQHVGQPATFQASLSGSLATRMENLLIINGGPDASKALGVVHEATQAASKQGVTRWATSPLDRRKLFELRYRSAWGSESVQADAFLTGEVKLSKDLKKTSVSVQSFDRTSPGEMVTLAQFTMNTDRNVLRDMGYSFQVRGRSTLMARRQGGSPIVVEELPDDEKDDTPTKKDEPEPGPAQPTDQVTRPVNVGGIEVQMLADGRPTSFEERPSAADGAAWQVKCPPPGATVQFRLKNNSSKRLAIALRLNGVNTINEQKDAPERCGKWILDAGKSVQVKGFLLLGEATGGKNEVLPIKVLVGPEASKIRAEMGDKTGLLQVDVFEDGSDSAEITVTPRGLPPSKDKAARASYVSLRDALLKSSGLKKQMVKTREVLGPDRGTGPAPGYGGVKVVPFATPKLVASVTAKVVPPGGGE